MRILIDVMSGDNAPLELLRGAVMAANEYPKLTIAVVGSEDVIRETAETDGLSLDGLEIIPSHSVIEMEDKALSVVRDKKDSSMSVGLHALASGEGDAFVSAGNTGALLAGATLLVRRIRGIQRAGIASVLPFPTPVLLMDCGANLEVTPENLEQFAYMGSLYMEKVYGIASPRVGLINNGTEYNKGLPLQVATYERLTRSGLNFIGNVEGKTIPFGSCDVAVTDGFSGNLVLKFMEGLAKFFSGALKDLFHTNATTKLSGLLIRGKIGDFKKKFDASEHGGAPLLGISKPVIKAHGSSDANAIKHAVHQAMTFVNTGINYDVAEWAAAFEEKLKAEAEAAKHSKDESDTNE
ncbi:MAG: phosphate acyltransferase PlsX [Clostridia bacterium]|nr:phosphate acyltransferase PlsX [Clostridia bacterium]